MIFELLHYLRITSVERKVFLSMLTLDMGFFFSSPGRFVIHSIYVHNVTFLQCFVDVVLGSF